MAELVPIANLRGPRGFQGIQGLPGVNATPADEAVAGYISTGGTSATQSAADARYGSTMYAPAYGVVGDGAADDAAAFAALLNTAATFGASVTLEAGSTLLVGATIAPPSGTRLFGNGAEVKKKSTLAGVGFNIGAVSDVLVENLRVDGQKALFASSEHQHGFYIVNGAERITLRGIYVHDCNGDGIYVGDQTAASKSIVIENVFSHANNRQGMSISHVSGLSCSNSWFTATNGTNPRAGVDIEPNADGVVCENITFTSCRFAGNGHFGFVVAGRAAPTVHHGAISLVGCHIHGNGTASASFGGGLNLRAARGFSMIGGSIHHNIGPGVRMDWTTICTDIELVGVQIYENSQHGFQVTSGFDGLSIETCIFRGNGTGNPGAYAGIGIYPTIASTNLKVIGSTSGGATQRYGLQTSVTSGTISNVTLVGNDYPGNSTGARALADDAATRLDLDRVGKVTVTGSRGGNAALASMLTGLATRGIITDSTTA